jgi:hypothetical protein
LTALSIRGTRYAMDTQREAKTAAGARAQLKEALRLYFRKVLGR